MCRRSRADVAQQGGSVRQLSKAAQGAFTCVCHGEAVSCAASLLQCPRVNVRLRTCWPASTMDPGNLPLLQNAPPLDDQGAVAAYQEHGGNALDRSAAQALGLLFHLAPSFFPTALRDLDLIGSVLKGALDRDLPDAEIRRAFTVACAGEDCAMQHLRRVRHRMLVRIVLRELLGLLNMEQTGQRLSVVAEACVQSALDVALKLEGQRHAPPEVTSHVPVELSVLGMGKLGGNELNLDSDIDLCCFYSTDQTCSDDRTSYQFFSSVIQTLTRLLEQPTEDGYCYRVDWRLRPYGQKGPLVSSQSSAEQYYLERGELWERAALLRARPIAGSLAFGNQLLGGLMPFIYRRQVDPAIPSRLHALLRRSQQALHEAEGLDVKLAAGGIREAEFFVQSLQLIWGGRHVALRERGTLPALRALERAGMTSAGESQVIATSWELLRRVEHSIHLRSDHQTHVLPPADDGQETLRALHLGSTYREKLRASMSDVHALFTSLLEATEAEPHTPSSLKEHTALAEALAHAGVTKENLQRAAELLHVQDPDELKSHLMRLISSRESPFTSSGLARWPLLAPTLLQEVSRAADPTAALLSLSDFFSKLGGYTAYIKVLSEEPSMAQKLVRLFGSSPHLSATLMRHLEEFDHLFFASLPPTTKDVSDIHIRALSQTHTTPWQSFSEQLRSAKREVALRAGLAWINQRLPLEEVMGVLSELAEQQVMSALACTCAELDSEAQRQIDVAVVAGGKLGSKELSFGGDLDLVFVYQSQAGCFLTEAEQLTHVTRVAQRVVHLLSQPSGEGPGYKVDLRLRPNSYQGLLVSSFAALRTYYTSRAEGWERQATIKMRVLGDHQHAQLNASLQAFLLAQAIEESARPQEFGEMKARLEREVGRESSGRMHPKYGFGALLELEFLVQFLQMKHIRISRERGTPGAVRQLRHAGQLSPAEAKNLSDAYAFYRRIEMTRDLLERNPQPFISIPSPSMDRLARAMDLHPADSVDHPFLQQYATHADNVRSVFSHLVSPLPSERPSWMKRLPSHL